jgi:adenine-specific DNA methylase
MRTTEQNKTKQDKIKQNIMTKRTTHMKINLTDMIDYKRRTTQWESEETKVVDIILTERIMIMRSDQRKIEKSSLV